VTCVRLSSVVVCRLYEIYIVAKWCVEQKLEPIESHIGLWEIDWYQNEWPWPSFRGRDIAWHSALNISETIRGRGLVLMTTNKNGIMDYQMVTWPMTSRDPEGAVKQYGRLSYSDSLIGFLSILQILNKQGVGVMGRTHPKAVMFLKLLFYHPNSSKICAKSSHFCNPVSKKGWIVKRNIFVVVLVTLNLKQSSHFRK